MTTSYTQGWFAGLTTSASGGTTLANTVTYAGTGGAFGQPTGMTLGTGGAITYAATYDALARPTDSKWTTASGGAVQFDEQRSYDAVGNVATVGTTLAAGTDHQAYCYDEQNRLTWASAASGTIQCGGTNTAGTLTSASYTQSFAYDPLNRLTSGPAGSYTYGDSAHLHAATAIGAAYTAKYDAAGDMTCRAPSSATTCAGAPTGAQLTYDAEGRLSAWQNAPSNPTSTATFLYDGAGQCVAQVTGASTTVYVGTLEAVTTSGGTTTTTTYYHGGGKLLAEAVNGTVSYLATTAQGSVVAALSSSGATSAAQLFAPYGGGRYSSGTLPTDYGYTGQRADVTTGLDYYHARYYDPAAAQFGSADTVADGLNRYGYVAGNPTTATDPTRHRVVYDSGDESSCDTCDSVQPPVSIFPKGDPYCPSSGCAYANDHRAIVGAGEQVQTGSGNNPAEYRWQNEDKSNGAMAVGYSGKSLGTLIELMTVILNWMQERRDRIDALWGPAADTVAAFAGFLVERFGIFFDIPPGSGKQVSDNVSADLAAADQFVVTMLDAGIDRVTKGVNALTSARGVGGTVWYVEGTRTRSQTIGLANFELGWGPQPSREVFRQVGITMIQQCQDFENSPSSPFGSSPGVNKQQDSNYVAPNTCE